MFKYKTLYIPLSINEIPRLPLKKFGEVPNDKLLQTQKIFQFH